MLLATPTAVALSTLLLAALTTAASLLPLLLFRAPFTPTSPETTTATRLARLCPCLRLTGLATRRFHTTLLLLDVVDLSLLFPIGSRDGLLATSAPLRLLPISTLVFTILGGNVQALTACCDTSRLTEGATHGPRFQRLTSRKRLLISFPLTLSHNLLLYADKYWADSDVHLQ